MSQERTPLTIPAELDAEMTPAVRAFVKVLLARIESLENEVAELKRRLGQTPENSSRPPSSQHPPMLRRNRARSRRARSGAVSRDTRGISEPWSRRSRSPRRFD